MSTKKESPEEYEKNKQKFIDNHKINPIDGTTVRPGNFKPYLALCKHYQIDPRDLKVEKKSTPRVTKKATIDTSDEDSENSIEKIEKKKSVKKDAKQIDSDKEKSEEEIKVEKKTSTKRITKKVNVNVENNDVVSKDIKPVIEEKTEKIEEKVLNKTEKAKPVETVKPLVITEPNTLPTTEKEWIMKFEDEGFFYKKCGKNDEWQAEYNKMMELKNEAIKMIKVNMATTTNISCKFIFNYDKTMKNLFPTSLAPSGSGECTLLLTLKHKWKIPTNEDEWLINYCEDFSMEDQPMEDQTIKFKDVIYILTSIINYNKNNNIGIHIKNGGKEKLSLNREFLNAKNEAAKVLIVAYNMADLC